MTPTVGTPVLLTDTTIYDEKGGRGDIDYDHGCGGGDDDHGNSGAWKNEVVAIEVFRVYNRPCWKARGSLGA